MVLLVAVVYAHITGLLYTTLVCVPPVLYQWVVQTCHARYTCVSCRASSHA